MRPDRVVSSIYDVQAEDLLRSGVRALLLDLDDTLVAFNRTEATPNLLQWLGNLRRSGLQLAIISNNCRDRVMQFADPLAIPYVCAAFKPLQGSFQHALALVRAKPEEAAIMGDQLLTDVLGGNRAGLRTIFVQPISFRGGIWADLNRRLEKILFRWMDRHRGKGCDAP